MMRARFKLHNRLGWVIVAVVVATSCIFALFAIALAYSVEDELFVRALNEEIKRQQLSWHQNEQLQTPQLGYIKIYRRQTDLPEDLSTRTKEEPERIEFNGNFGRHYHIEKFFLDPSDSEPAFAVAEVGDYLVVRPSLLPLLKFVGVLTSAIAVVMGIAGILLARRALMPLNTLARDVDATRGQIPEIDPSQFPSNEIGTLAECLSMNFQRINGFLERERSFTRDASHELRTPIAIIAGAAEVIGLQENLTRSSRDALLRIREATEHMADTLELLLALAREQDLGKCESVQLLQIVQRATKDATDRFPVQGLDVQVEIAPNVIVFQRPILLRNILTNLIGNSLQHSAATSLTITSKEGSNLTISDNGVGIKDRGDPFQAYIKSATSTGSGLGLAIVRRFCEAEQIDLQYSFDGPSGGVKYVLRFHQQPGCEKVGR